MSDQGLQPWVRGSSFLEGATCQGCEKSPRELLIPGFQSKLWADISQRRQRYLEPVLAWDIRGPKSQFRAPVSQFRTPPSQLKTPPAQFKTPAARFWNSTAAARNSNSAALNCVAAPPNSIIRVQSSDAAGLDLRHCSSKPRHRSSLPATSRLWSSDNRVLTSAFTAFRRAHWDFPAVRGLLTGLRS